MAGDQARAPDLAASGAGRIVNIASVVGRATGARPLCRLEARVEGLPFGAARELRATGITVNTVAPGLVHNAATRALNSDEYLAIASRARAIPRAMTPGDLVGARAVAGWSGLGVRHRQDLVVDGGGVFVWQRPRLPPVIPARSRRRSRRWPPLRVRRQRGLCRAGNDGAAGHSTTVPSPGAHAWADLIGGVRRPEVADLVREAARPFTEARIELAGAMDALRFKPGSPGCRSGRAGRSRTAGGAPGAGAGRSDGIHHAVELAGAAPAA